MITAEKARENQKPLIEKSIEKELESILQDISYASLNSIKSEIERDSINQKNREILTELGYAVYGYPGKGWIIEW